MSNPKDEVIRRAVEAVVKGEFPEVRRCTAVIDIDRRTVDLVCYTGATIVHGLQPTIASVLLGALPRNFRIHVEVYDGNVH
jgi:hypothetical protein